MELLHVSNDFFLHRQSGERVRVGDLGPFNSVVHEVVQGFFRQIGRGGSGHFLVKDDFEGEALRSGLDEFFDVPLPDVYGEFASLSDGHFDFIGSFLPTVGDHVLGQAE